MAPLAAERFGGLRVFTPSKMGDHHDGLFFPFYVMATRIYLGLAVGNRQIFRSETEPTRETHGKQFNAVVGPFRTRRGAEFMRDHGQANPHCQTVAQAERLGAKYAHDRV